MAYDFFLSYTRANNDAFLRKFYELLCAKIVDVRKTRGLDLPEEIGFFDQHDIELGENWDASIVEGLQTSKVFLAVTSEEYFKSDYCGKEWQLFHDRVSLGNPTPAPPLIKPIFWKPFNLQTLPAGILAGQIKRGDPSALHNVEGYKYLLKNFIEQEQAWNLLIASLAEEIVDAGQSYPLNPLESVGALKDATSAFLVPPVGARTGPKRVRFAYMAADPNTFGAARNADAYQDTGGADWKPFFPESQVPLHQEVQLFVAGPDLNFTSDELKIGPDFLKDLDEAEEKRQLVVLFVDGWSLQWDKEYQRILSDLDRKLGYWCVIVPMNEKDTDTAKVRDRIDQAIEANFRLHAKVSPNPLFYRDNIKSTAELKKELADVLVKLKEEVKKRAVVMMPVPSGPSRTVVRGPSAQN